MAENTNPSSIDITDRTFRFSVNVIRLFLEHKRNNVIVILNYAF